MLGHGGYHVHSAGGTLVLGNVDFGFYALRDLSDSNGSIFRHSLDRKAACRPQRQILTALNGPEILKLHIFPDNF